MFDINIKSGDSGHFNYDGCDMCVTTIPSNNVPRVGDTLIVKQQKYLVRDIVREYWDVKECFAEHIDVYVVKL